LTYTHKIGILNDTKRINDQWRICFSMNDGHFYNVEIVDYH